VAVEPELGAQRGEPVRVLQRRLEILGREALTELKLQPGAREPLAVVEPVDLHVHQLAVPPFSGNGSNPHLAAADLLNWVGIRMEHIPYRGSTAAHADLIAR
jgi:hypothetical protein